MKRALETVIILRYATSNSLELVSAVERCLDQIEQSDLTLHWSFPLHPLASDSSSRAEKVVARIRERTGDRLVPIGFTGAYHQLLKPDELRKELLWSRKNPWNEDPKTLFGVDAVPALFPLSLDLARAPARGAYRKEPRLLLENPTGKGIFFIEGESYIEVPSVQASSIDSKRLQKELFRQYRRESTKQLVVVVDGLAAGSEHLESILTILGLAAERRPGFKVAAIEEFGAGATSSEIDRLATQTTPIPVDPVSRSFRSTEHPGKRGRRRNADELLKQRLERISIVDIERARGELDPAGELKLEERTLVADMSGEVTLSEAAIGVHFRGGHMAGIRHAGHEILCNRPARSFMTLDGRAVEFSTVGCFSFEAERSRGLRVIQKLDGESTSSPGQLIGDYYFEEGERDLLVSLSISYPELKDIAQVDAYSMLELPLFSPPHGNAVDIEAEYPEGERYTVRVESNTAPFQLCGYRFRFQCGSSALRLLFPRLQNALPEVLTVGFRPLAGAEVFYVNLRGSSIPAEATAFPGMTEQLHFSIDAESLVEPAAGNPHEKALPVGGSK